MRFLLLFYIIITSNVFAVSLALFDHQTSPNFKINHKIINYDSRIAHTNKHADNLLCNLHKKIKLYSYPFLEKKENSYYFDSLKDAISKRIDYIWIPSSSDQYSEKELALMKIAEKLGIIIVTSAGNESLDLNRNKRYPCSYNLSNIRCIQTKEKFSNYIHNGVTIIKSDLPNCDGSIGKGTSQATVIYLNQILD